MIEMQYIFSKRHITSLNLLEEKARSEKIMIFYVLQ